MKPLNKYCQYFSLENIVVAALCIMALFAKSKIMTDQAIVPKQLYTGLVLSLSIVAIAIKLLLGKGFKITPFSWSVIITAICSAEALYAIFQFSVTRLLGLDVFICGTFDHPVGLMSALCLALPFSLYAVTQSTHYRKVLTVAIVLIVIAILISESRAGILATVLILLCYVLKLSKLSPTKCVIIICSVCVLLIAASCLINTDSVSGRLLIWRASWPLITATPFCGYGMGAFGRMYMAAQADYLSAFSPDSDYAMLAGNSIVPFNEYIDLYLNFGMLGLILLIGFISLLIYAYRRSPDNSKLYALLSLGALAFISLFSYPFTYPFSYVIIIVSTIIIVKGSYDIKLPRPVKYISAAVILLCGIYVSYLANDRIDAELQWGKAFNRSDLTLYSNLKPRLKDNPYFLYNYASEAFEQNEYDLSLSVAEECADILSNYYLELLLADINFEIGDYESSAQHYQMSAAMCPCRFMPLLGIFEIYEANENFSKATETATLILNKPVKKSSTKIESIRLRIKKFFEKNYTQYNN